MGEIGIKIGSLALILGLGFLLRQREFLKKEDCRTLMALYMNVTLPAAVIAGFQDFQRNLSLIFVAWIAILMNCTMCFIGYLAGGREGKEEQAFGIINYSGYNVGAFAMPFLQCFLGERGVMVASIFDSGNAVMCSGFCYLAAKSVLEGGGGQKLGKSLKTLFRVVPFDVYVGMMLLYFADIHLPAAVYRLAGGIGNANAFLAMLVIGSSIHLDFSGGKMRKVAKNLVIRCGMAVVIGGMLYQFAPFEKQIRQILVILALAPVSSITVVNTAKCGLDEERAGLVNSATILVSLIPMMLLPVWWGLGG